MDAASNAFTRFECVAALPLISRTCVMFRVLQEVGNWSWFQRLLETLNTVAQKHGTTISNVASRWVLDKPQTPAIILGARNANHVQVWARLS